MELSTPMLEAVWERKQAWEWTFTERKKAIREKRKKAIREYRSLERLILEEWFLEHLERRLSDSSQAREITENLSESEIIDMVARKAVALIEVLWDPDNRIAVRYTELKRRIQKGFAAREKLKPVPEKPLELTQKIRLLASKVLTYTGVVTPKSIRHYPPSLKQ